MAGFSLLLTGFVRVITNVRKNLPFFFHPLSAGTGSEIVRICSRHPGIPYSHWQQLQFSGAICTASLLEQEPTAGKSAVLITGDF